MTEKELIKQLKSLKSKPEAGALPQERGNLMYANLMAKIENDSPINYESSRITKRITNVFIHQFSRVAFRYALTLFVIFVIGIGGSLTTVSASFNSLPGDTLYTIKLTAEKIQLALAQDEAMKINLRTQFAARRVDEMKSIIESSLNNKDKRIEEALSNFKVEIEGVASSLGKVDEETATGKAKFISEKINELNDIIVINAPKLSDKIKEATNEISGVFIKLPEKAKENSSENNSQNAEIQGKDANSDVFGEVETVTPNTDASSSSQHTPPLSEGNDVPEAPKKIQFQMIIEE